jgi:hypothetical protein
MSELINQNVIEQLPLDQIEQVTFYKRDEITTDLICCDVELNGQTWSFHEEAIGWDSLLHHLERLPGFKSDWYEAVVQPPFAASGTVAFKRD